MTGANCDCEDDILLTMSDEVRKDIEKLDSIYEILHGHKPDQRDFHMDELCMMCEGLLYYLKKKDQIIKCMNATQIKISITDTPHISGINNKELYGSTALWKLHITNSNGSFDIEAKAYEENSYKAIVWTGITKREEKSSEQ